MEFIIVKVAGKEDEAYDVLVNGEKNGKTGDVLQLDEGFVEISVDLEGAKIVEAELMDTTVNHPMEVIVTCT